MHIQPWSLAAARCDDCEISCAPSTSTTDPFLICSGMLSCVCTCAFVLVSSRLFRFVVFEAMFKPLARYVWFGVSRRLPVQKIVSDVSSDSQSLVVVAGLLEHWVAPTLSSDASCNATQRSTERYAAQNKQIRCAARPHVFHFFHIRKAHHFIF